MEYCEQSSKIQSQWFGLKSLQVILKVTGKPFLTSEAVTVLNYCGLSGLTSKHAKDGASLQPENLAMRQKPPTLAGCHSKKHSTHGGNSIPAALPTTSNKRQGNFVRSYNNEGFWFRDDHTWRVCGT